jgi:hypothetical protein
MQSRSSTKRPRDLNQLTRVFVDLVTGNPIGEDISPIADKAKNLATIEPERYSRLKDKAGAAKSRPNKARKER